MKDLRDIIKNVLTDAMPIICNEASPLTRYSSVNTQLLKVLQAEYNIHCVEPEDEQLEVV